MLYKYQIYTLPPLFWSAMNIQITREKNAMLDSFLHLLVVNSTLIEMGYLDGLSLAHLLQIVAHILNISLGVINVKTYS